MHRDFILATTCADTRIIITLCGLAKWMADIVSKSVCMLGDTCAKATPCAHNVFDEFYTARKQDKVLIACIWFLDLNSHFSISIKKNAFEHTNRSCTWTLCKVLRWLRWVCVWLCFTTTGKQNALSRFMPSNITSFLGFTTEASGASSRPFNLPCCVTPEVFGQQATNTPAARKGPLGIGWLKFVCLFQ